MTNLTELLKEISNGVYDDHIRTVIDALVYREKALRTLREQQNLISLSIGAKVRLEGLSPKGLNGLTGIVKGTDGSRVNVELDKEIYHLRRFFGQKNLRVPASCVVPQ